MSLYQKTRKVKKTPESIKAALERERRLAEKIAADAKNSIGVATGSQYRPFSVLAKLKKERMAS